MGAFQARHFSRLLIVVALVAAAGALVMASGRAGRLPAADLYERSSQRLIQADLLYRLSLFWKSSSGPEALPGIGGASELSERAVAEYERVALVTPPNPHALHRLGIIYGQRGYASQAQQVLTRAATLDEAHAPLYFALAEVYGPRTAGQPLPADIPLRLEQQERWLADMSLAAYYQASDDPAHAAQVQLRQARSLNIFGQQAMVLLGVYGGIGLIGLITVLVLIIRRGFGVAVVRPSRPPLVVPWEPLDVIETVAILYFGMAALGALAGLALRHLPETPAADTARAAVVALQYLLFSSAAVVFIWNRVRAPQGRRLRALGVRLAQPLRLIAEGIGGYGVLLVVLAVTGFGRPALLSLVAAVQSSESLVNSMQTTPAKLVLFLLICVVAPVLEELIFRGFVYPGLRRRLSVVGAVLASALLFALMHNDPGALLPIGLIGIILAALYERNRSVVPSIICHALNNTLVFFVMVLAQ